MTTITTSTDRTTITTPAVAPSGTLSIRQICRSGILAGKTSKEIAAEIIATHPTSAAAAKSGKHIAWYRATMKKAGELPLPASN